IRERQPHLERGFRIQSTYTTFRYRLESAECRPERGLDQALSERMGGKIPLPRTGGAPERAPASLEDRGARCQPRRAANCSCICGTSAIPGGRQARLPRNRCGQMPDLPGERMPFGSMASFNFSWKRRIAWSLNVYISATLSMNAMCVRYSAQPFSAETSTKRSKISRLCLFCSLSRDIGKPNSSTRARGLYDHGSAAN